MAQDSENESVKTENSDEKTGSEKTRVLYLNHAAQMSGAEASLRALLWQLRRESDDIEPTIALPGGGPFSEVLRDEGWNVTFAPLRRLHRPQSFLDGMAALVHILQTTPFITRLARQTGAQLIHSNSTTAHLVGALAGERLKIPTLWHVRDLVSLARIVPSLAPRTTLAVAISKCVAKRLQDDGVPEDKIRVIYNGLDPDEWRIGENKVSALRESLGADENAFLFCCAGQLVPWKNHRAFIEAAARLMQDEECGQARFVIMGGDLWGEQQDYVRELRALVKKHNLQERFNFVPHQSESCQALAAFDAVVLPSLEEPFGRVMIEAMALKKTAIAFDVNGPSEIITHEHDGLLVPLPEKEDFHDDVKAKDKDKSKNKKQDDAGDEAIFDALAGAMKRVLQDRDLRLELGQAARRSVVEKFHISDSAQAIQKLYREALAEKS